MYNVRRIRKTLRSSDNGVARYRYLQIPTGSLLKIQSAIFTRVLSNIATPDYLWAFEKDRAIPGMAAVHSGKDWVLSFDIKDYFKSVKTTHIIPALGNIGLLDDAARTVAELCTYKWYLPQGARTSPKLSNLVAANTFGPVLDSFCKHVGITMTIYADDITMSFNQDQDSLRNILMCLSPSVVDIPSEIPITLVSDKIIEFVRLTLRSFEFRLNDSKTKLMGRGRRQYVCGVVVNVKPNLQKSNRNWLRAVIHNIGKNGAEAEAAKNNLTVGEFISKLRGKVQWHAQLNPERGNRMKAELDKHLSDQSLLEFM